MRRVLFVLSVLFLLGAAWPPRPGLAQACPDLCAIDGPGGGDYTVLEPDNWDGVSKLPVLIWFHGWQRTGKGVVRNQKVGGVTRQRGVLLVAPNGEGKSWSVFGEQLGQRDDLAFTRKVIDDVKSRWPVDEDRIWVSGFSLGSSMAWNVACYMGSEVDAVFPVSGVFWRPHPKSCPDPVARLSHVHGTADPVMPLDGRSFDNGLSQGNVFQSFSVMLSSRGFGEFPSRSIEDRNRKCDIWENPEKGEFMELCLHPKGHFIPADWVGRSIDQANRLTDASGS